MLRALVEVAPAAEEAAVQLGRRSGPEIVEEPRFLADHPAAAAFHLTRGGKKPHRRPAPLDELQGAAGQELVLAVSLLIGVQMTTWSTT
jgi:hypothetical protein